MIIPNISNIKFMFQTTNMIPKVGTVASLKVTLYYYIYIYKTICKYYFIFITIKISKYIYIYITINI